jgi:integrase
MARPNKPWFRASKGTWYATVDGRKVSLGVQGEENFKAAHEAWHRLMAGIKEQKARPKSEPTVGEVIRQFLADCEGRMKPKTLRGYRDFLTPFVESNGRLVTSELTPPLVEAYSRRPQWSPASRAGFLGTIKTAFKWAVRARLLSANPLAEVKIPSKPSRGMNVLISAEEHAKLLALASPSLARFLTVLYATGARPGEVAAITAENFDPKAGVVRLRDHKMAHKGKHRVIYLPPEVVALLTELAKENPHGPLLRTCWGNPWRGTAIVKEMIRLRERGGIPHVTAYGYRHSFATDALANGVPDAQVAELLGHSGTAMLHRHYSHLTARSQVLQAALGRVRS